jgi:hypothetical protein
VTRLNQVGRSPADGYLGAGSGGAPTDIPLPRPAGSCMSSSLRPPGPSPPGHAEHWSGWTRSHQARACWFHHRARLTRHQDLTMNALAS